MVRGNVFKLEINKVKVGNYQKMKIFVQ